MKIIVINGGAEVGKDKFVEIFKEVSGRRVKSVAELCFGWNGKKCEKSRKFLSEIKRAWSEFNDGPTNDIINRINIDREYCIEKGKDLENTVYFIHIREPHEIEKIIDIYGKENCLTLLIRKDVDISPDNLSDKNVENYEYQHIIENSGDIDHLRHITKKFIENLNY
jgi:hypothetical protein